MIVIPVLSRHALRCCYIIMPLCDYCACIVSPCFAVNCAWRAGCRLWGSAALRRTCSPPARRARAQMLCCTYIIFLCFGVLLYFGVVQNFSYYMIML